MSRSTYVMKTLAGLVFLTATGSAFAASGATTQTVQGGTINFTGTVVDAACAVDVNSESQNISLGQVRLAELDKVGATSTPMKVQIQLDDCDSTVATSATFMFTGQIDSDDSASLANTSSDAGKAKGVGVSMTDASGSKVTFDGSADAGSKLTLVDGNNYADFSASMIATTATPTAGDVAATVNFKIQYE